MDQKSHFRLQLLLNSNNLDQPLVNILKSLILTYTNDVIIPSDIDGFKPGPLIIKERLKNLNYFRVFLSSVKSCYLHSDRNYNQFRQSLINEDPIAYLLFHLLIDTTIKLPLVTFDYFDNLGLHLLNNWARINQIILPDLDVLFLLLEQLPIHQPRAEKPSKNFMFHHQGLQYQVVHK